MSSTKQKMAARKNIKKANAKWKSMSHAERKKAMPKRKYEIHTSKWHDLVNDLRRKGNVSSPEAVATSVLGAKSFLKRRHH